jgi:hypothetical protein
MSNLTQVSYLGWIGNPFLVVKKHVVPKATPCLGINVECASFGKSCASSVQGDLDELNMCQQGYRVA